MIRYYKTLALILAVFLLAGCKVSKQVNTSKNETEREIKVDSSSQVKADITKENRIETVVTEEIDTTVFTDREGHILADTANAKGEVIKVPIKKKKVTKRTETAKEVDKSVTKVDVKKKEQTKAEIKEVQKEVHKSSLGLWWLVLVIILAAYLCWRFYIRKL